jgi:hypothetical protein
MLNLKKVFLTISMLGTVLGCGNFDFSKKNSDKSSDSKRVLVGFDFSTKSPSDESLSLVSNFSSDFVIAITGCSSGYTTTVTSTTAVPVTAVSLYAFDTDCVAGLVNFVYNTKTYTKQGGGSLTTGTSLFSETGGGLLNVTVGTNLPSPLSSGAQVKFVVEEIKLGADYAVTGYSVSEALEIAGVEAPNLKMQAAALTAIASGTGFPSFDLSLECNLATQSASSICPTPGGDLQTMTSMKAKLIVDTYSGVITIAEAQTIMASGTTSVAAGNLLGTIGANGGFKLNLTQSTGPLFTNKNMLLVVSFTDAGGAVSYRYFNIDIGSPI